MGKLKTSSIAAITMRVRHYNSFKSEETVLYLPVEEESILYGKTTRVISLRHIQALMNGLYLLHANRGSHASDLTPIFSSTVKFLAKMRCHSSHHVGFRTSGCTVCFGMQRIRGFALRCLQQSLAQGNKKLIAVYESIMEELDEGSTFKHQAHIQDNLALCKTKD